MGSTFDNQQTDLLQERYGGGLTEETKNAPWTSTISILLQHLSFRRFLRDQPLPDGTLQTLMAAAQSASTGSMLQSWSAIAITDPQRKDHVVTLCGDQDFIRQAPLFLLFCIDLRRIAEASAQHGTPSEGLKRIYLFIVGALDAGMAAQNAAIAAESLGLGTCYVGGARNNAQELSEYLELPSRVMGLFGMAVGKADPGFMNARKPRLPMAEVLHMDVWNDDDHKESVSKYEESLRLHYERQGKGGRRAWTAQIADFVTSGELDGRGRMRDVLDRQGFEFL